MQKGFVWQRAPLLLILVWLTTALNSVEKNLAEKYFRQGQAYEQVGNWQSAHYYYMLAFRKNPQEPQILEAYGNAQAAIGLFYEAAATFQKLLKRNPKSHKAHRFLGQYFAKRRRHQKAVKHLQAYLKLSQKRDTDILLLLAEELSFLKQSHQLKSLLQRYHIPSPKLHKECSFRKNLEKTLCYQKLAHLELNNPQLLLRLSKLYKKLPKKRQVLRRLYLLFKDNPRYIWPYAFFLYEQKQYLKSKKLFQELASNTTGQARQTALDMLQVLALEKPSP